MHPAKPGSFVVEEMGKLKFSEKVDIDGLKKWKPKHASFSSHKLSAIQQTSDETIFSSDSPGSGPVSRDSDDVGMAWSDFYSPGSLCGNDKTKAGTSTAAARSSSIKIECKWCHTQCLSVRKDGCRECMKRRCLPMLPMLPLSTVASSLLKAEKDRREEARCRRIRAVEWDASVAWNRRMERERRLAEGRLEKYLSWEHQGDERRRSVSVIVVGAGMAGLSAAEELLKSGFENVTILEASDRVGGRIHTATLGQGSDGVIDLGVSQLEHLEEWNSVFGLARRQGLLNGGVITSHLRSNLSTKAVPSETVICKGRKSFFYNMMIDHEIATLNELNSRSSRPGSKVIHLSSSDYFRETLRRLQNHSVNHTASMNGQKGESPAVCPSVTSAVQAYCKEIQCQHGDSLGDADVQTFTTDHKRSVTSVKDGMACVLKPLTKQLKDKPNAIQFNAKVSRIDWSKFTKENIKKVKRPVVDLVCSDGRVFHARHVIVTTPLGFLKANARKLFNPKLPDTKLNAIDRLGFGAVCKAFICFQKPVYLHGFYVALTTTTGDEGEYGVSTKTKVENVIVNFKQNPNSCVVEFAFSNSSPEDMNDDELLKDLIVVLENRLLRTMSPAVGFVKSSWKENALYKGTHPYVKVSGSQKDADVLAQPIRLGSIPVIQFAGDATHKDYTCLLHAARASGLREAERLKAVCDPLYGHGNNNDKTLDEWEL